MPFHSELDLYANFPKFHLFNLNALRKLIKIGQKATWIHLNEP